MLFLLIGLGVLAASAASWALLLADPSFSEAILQDGIMTFWWNSLTLLLSEPGWLVSTPSIAVPLLAATIGPFVGLPVAGIGTVALWRRPKEIEVQGRAARPAPVFRPAEPRPASRPMPIRRAVEEREDEVVPAPRMAPVGGMTDLEEVSDARAASRKGPGIGAKIGAKVGGLVTGVGAALSRLIAEMRAKSAAVAEQRAARKAAVVERRQAAEAPVRSSAPAAAIQDPEELQPLPDRIMAWYAAWVTVRAGQRPPKMLEDARRLSEELTSETRAAMTGYGMRGATALSMLESAASAGMARGMEEEEDVFLPPRQEGHSPVPQAALADADEFLREVEAPEPYRPSEGAQGSVSQAPQEAGPVVIEDDIAAPAPMAPPVETVGRMGETGPVVIEDDIGMPSVDRREGSREENLAARRVMEQRGREKIETGIEESEFLPAPGTLEPLEPNPTIVTTATTGWDEVEVRETPVETGASGAGVGASEVDLEGFQAEGALVGPVEPAFDSKEVEAPSVPVSERQDARAEEAGIVSEADVAEGWPSFGGPVQEASEVKEVPAPVVAGEDGWPPDGPKETVTVPVEERSAEADSRGAEGRPGADLPPSTSEGAPETTGVPEVGTPADVRAAVEEGWPADLPAVPTEAESVEEVSVATAELGPASAAVEGGADAPAASARAIEAEPEAPGVAEPGEAFPSGIAPEAQEAVIGQLLADPIRRATILGEREGSPAWTLRRLELHGLLGLSERTNPAVVRMWEALDRLVAHQARVFAWENLKEVPPAAFATPEQRAAHVVDLAREVVAERGRVGASLLEEIRRLKAGTEHVAWMDDRVDSLLAAMTSAKVIAQLGDFLPKPKEGKAEAGGRLLKVMTGRKEPDVTTLVEPAYEDLLAASHDIHQRYKEICKGLMIPLYRSLSVKVKEEDGRPAYAQVELVIGDVAATKQRSAAPEGAIGVIFATVPAGQWRITEANGRVTQDRLVLEGVGENAGRLVRLRDRSLDVFRRWVEGRNMRPFGVIHLLCEEGAVVDGIDRRWDGVEFIRNPWGQKDFEALQKSRLRPKAG